MALTVFLGHGLAGAAPFNLTEGAHATFFDSKLHTQGRVRVSKEGRHWLATRMIRSEKGEDSPVSTIQANLLPRVVAHIGALR